MSKFMEIETIDQKRGKPSMVYTQYVIAIGIELDVCYGWLALLSLPVAKATSAVDHRSWWLCVQWGHMVVKIIVHTTARDVLVSRM